MPTQAYMQQQLEKAQPTTLSKVKQGAQAIAKATTKTALKHLGTGVIHGVQHAQLVSDQIATHKANHHEKKGATSHVSTAAQYAVEHVKQSVVHAKDHVKVAATNLRSESKVDRAVGAADMVLQATVARGALTVASDIGGFFLSAIYTSDASEEQNSYMQSIRNWVPYVLLAGTVAAVAAVKFRSATERVGRFFGGELPVREMEASADDQDATLESTRALRL